MTRAVVMGTMVCQTDATIGLDHFGARYLSAAQGDLLAQTVITQC